SPQSVPPLAPPGALVLHLTARYLDAEGRVEKERPDFHEVPGEDWIRLSAEECRTLLPAAGPSIAVDPAIAERLLTHFHPSDMSIDLEPNRRNRFQEVVLKATRYSPSFVRLDGRLRMTRSFTQVEKTPELRVSASVRGVLEIDPDGSRIRSLLLITDRATYGSHSFGVAVRSVP
ncbi:MAG TPA: hypothetical protein VE981_22175, partial [Planctomycetota bacterium]|nr:hypothetical protein [Planctomycetota bacterium]